MKKMRILNVVFDAVTMAGCWPLAWLIRYGLGSAVDSPINPIISYLYAWPLVVLVGILTGFGFGIYRPKLVDSVWVDGLLVAKAIFLNMLLVATLGFLFKEFDFGRAVVLNYVLLLAVFLPVSHTLWRVFERRARANGSYDRKVLIVGAGSSGLRALQRLDDSGYIVAGFLDDGTTRELPRPLLGTLAGLKEAVITNGIDEVVFAIPSLGRDRQMQLIMELEDLPVDIQVVSTLFGVVASNEQVAFIGDIPVFTLQSNLRDRPLYDISKRLMDFSASFLVLLCSLPIWILIAVAIKWDAPGPVFFNQKRVGIRGNEFKMYKFRTMRTDTDPYAVAPRDGTDPRITKVGAFLRRTSLDELPQLLNVLNGTMSLVGPRPEMPFIVSEYEPWQRRRLDVLPGVTGLWQIVGRKDLPLHENLEYDFYYMRNRSLIFDILILLRTIPAALLQKGAY